MGAAADRHEDPLDVQRSASLHDGDVARGLADDLVDGRGEDRGAVRAAVVTRRRLPAPAEDDEIRLLLGRRLDDPLGGVRADAHDRVDRRPVGGEPGPSGAGPGMPRARRSLGQGHPLGHFHDAERRAALRLCGSSIAAPRADENSGGLATGIRIPAGSGDFALTRLGPPARPRPRASA